MIAALEPLHEELERVSAHLNACTNWLLTITTGTSNIA